MTRPLITPAVADTEIPILNLSYLHACPTPSDPAMTWGTDVETAGLTDYISRANRGSRVLISPAHVLVKVVGRALELHPRFNRRILGRRLYRFRDINVLMPLQKGRDAGADLCLFKNVSRRSLKDVAEELWKRNRKSAHGKSRYRKQERIFRRLPRRLAGMLLRFQIGLTNRWNRPTDSYNEPFRSAPVLVNYLGFKGAPPMRSFQPSRFPTESLTLNVTMGPGEHRPAVHDGKVVVRRVAPLFVRADHRIVDAYDLGKLVDTLRSLLEEPGWIAGANGEVRPAAAGFGPRDLKSTRVIVKAASAGDSQLEKNAAFVLQNTADGSCEENNHKGPPARRCAGRIGR
ncbi:MAG: 2-oxo acid dehydrogenase subunit E2 [Planctomycetaceae bacterium]